MENLNVMPFDMGSRGIRLKNSDWKVDLDNHIKKFNPDLLAISSTEDMWELGMKVLEELKEYKLKNDIPVVAGGVFCTFAPDICISYPLVDMVCVGEGEQAIVDLCEKKKKHCLKVNFEIVKNIVNSVIKLKYNIFFLQISSDQVYSGKGPHDEKKIKPLNQYSLSKKYSEKWSSKINSCILRTNFF